MIEPPSAHRLLPQALHQYGLEQAHTNLLQDRWNHIYRVQAPDGKVYSLRICAPEFRQRPWLEDELRFLDFIAEQGALAAPRPTPNRSGDLVTVLHGSTGERLACLFRWVEGNPASQALTPEVLRQCGQLTARLHAVSRSFLFPDEENTFRPGYRYDQALARSHVTWIAEHEAEIGSSNQALLHEAIDYVCAGMDRVGQSRDTYGVLHGDLHFGNFLVHHGQVSLIDFDQLGRGHFLYDIAVLLMELRDAPASLHLRWQAFKTGYEEIGPLPFADDRELDPFLVAVCLAFLDWVYNAPNPQVRKEKMRYVPGMYDFIRTRVKEA